MMQLNLETAEPYTLSFTPAEGDLNAHGSVHGGVLFHLCSEAVAQFVYSRGREGAAADASIHYYRPALPGDKLTITVTERKAGRRLGVYWAEVRDGKGRLLADAAFTVAFAEGQEGR